MEVLRKAACQNLLKRASNGIHTTIGRRAASNSVAAKKTTFVHCPRAAEESETAYF